MSQWPHLSLKCMKITLPMPVDCGTGNPPTSNYFCFSIMHGIASCAAPRTLSRNTWAKKVTMATNQSLKNCAVQTFHSCYQNYFLSSKTEIQFALQTFQRTNKLQTIKLWHIELWINSYPRIVYSHSGHRKQDREYSP